jgi:hypothetical protein
MNALASAGISGYWGAALEANVGRLIGGEEHRDRSFDPA